MSSLLARFAENVFWLARYMERAENLARILDVNETFARDDKGEENWLPILQLNSDEARFFASHDKATAAAVVQFYVIDTDNPTSIVSAVQAARENARGLRHLISTEMWSHLNQFHGEMTSLKRRDVALVRLSRLCVRIKEHCQTHAGITDGTFYRDQAFCFYAIGKFIERADQTSRLLDMNYRHRALVGDDDSPLAISHWNAVLRSAAGYHAFRRIHPRGMKSADVAAFLLFDPGFPRSINNCVRRIDENMIRLSEAHGLKQGRPSRQALASLSRHMQRASMRAVARTGVSSYLDGVQQRLIRLTDELGRDFFAHDPDAAETATGGTARQASRSKATPGRSGSARSAPRAARR